MKVAFFDSGIGGLSVLHHALKVMPCDEFIFYADEDNVPYGIKTPQQVMKYVDEAFKFLIELKVDAIVVACNTATSVAVKEMRRRYELPIIGMEPAVKRAFDLYGDRRVLVTATPITINGDKIHSLIERIGKRNFIDLIALPDLVKFAEHLDFNSQSVVDYLTVQFKPFKFEEFSSIVLGCTHFNYFKDTMRKLLPKEIHFVDGNEGTINELIRRLKLKLKEESQLKSPKVEYYYSGRRIDSVEEIKRIEKYHQQLESVYEIN